MKKRIFYFLVVLSGFVFNASGQGTSCPENIDFETGTTNIWNYFIGTCCPGGAIVCTTSSTALTTRHRLTSGTGTDAYGGFPIVAPGGGTYSMKLGNSVTGAQAEKARYYVHVPTGSTNFSLVYRFAIVLQDPGSSHPAAARPRFEVNAYDSTTGGAIPCSQYSYVASGSLPGFVRSSVGSGDVYYHAWATASINLSGLGGSTVAIDFASGDCDYGGHFGYGYFDMECGLFALSATSCDSTGATFSAPAGYATYAWYDSATFSTLYGVGQTVTLSSSVPVTLAVILTPYTGFGCPDTLYTHLVPSDLRMNMMNDTTVCFASSVTLDSRSTDIVGPLSYTWWPAAGLSCTTCANPVCNPTTTTTYYVMVTNPVGCTKIDSVTVTGTFLPMAISGVNEPCHGDSLGSATVSFVGASTPLTYSWSTTPPQTDSTAINLAAGTYTVTLVDTLGCTGNLSITITEPPAKIITISGHTDPTTCGGWDGTITIIGLVPGSVDTFNYVFNGTPQTAILTASGSGQVVFTGLAQGLYDSFGVATALCPYNITNSVRLTDPAPPADPYAGSNTPICIGDTMFLNCIETSPGCAFNWTGPNGFVSTLQNPFKANINYPDSGMYHVTVSRYNCFKYDSTHVAIKPSPIPFAANTSPVCEGDSIYFSSYSTTGATAYRWNGPNSFSAIIANPVLPAASLAANGIYSVTITLNGCKRDAITNVVVNYVPAPPAVTDLNYCQFDPSLPLTASGSNLVWYTDTSLVGSTVAPTPSTALPGVYSWWVTETSPAGCTGYWNRINVTVHKMPEINFTMSDSILCAGNEVTFVGYNSGEVNSGITWNFGNGDSIKNINPVVYAFPYKGTYTITTTTYYKYCPVKSISNTVNVYPSPMVDLGRDTTICTGSTQFVYSDIYNNSNPLARWIWSNGDTTSSIIVNTPGTYYVKVMVDGCPATDTVVVRKDCYMDIPNVFSPNGDGLNDYFFPRHFLTMGLTGFKMDIYNRWGQLIFTTNKAEGNGWDGRLNNILQPEGVYVYMIEGTFKDGVVEKHSGNVTLLK